MKTARVQVLTTPAFRTWLQKEARNAGVSVGELVRRRCEGASREEEEAVAELATQLGERSAEGAGVFAGQSGRCGGADCRAEIEPGASPGCGALVSLLGQTLEAIKDAMKLADDVRRAAKHLKN